MADSMDELKAMLTALTEQMSQAQADLSPVTEEINTIDEAEEEAKREYRLKMEALRDQKYTLAEKRREKQAAVDKVNQQILIAKNRLQMLERAEAEKKAAEEAAKRAAAAEAAKAEEAATLHKRFDLVTAGAKWREWAKDHQISGGHHLTENRKVILGDPMGLGKTLTSIITCDMIEGATKEASEEFPFLGDEKEVFVPTQFCWTELGVKTCFDQEDYWAPDAYFSGDFNFEAGTFRGHTPVVGKPFPGFLQYDMRARMVDRGYIEEVPHHYETKIVNSVVAPAGRKILYFCPAPLLRNVLEEFRDWAPHREVTYIGKMSKAERNFALSFLPQLDQYVIIVNYEAWRRDSKLLDELINCEFDTIIIDEAHMIKDMKSNAFKGVKRVIEGCNPPYVIPMTGTPILNRPQELFSLLNLILPEQFYNENDYLYSYCEQYQPVDADGNDAGTPKWRFKDGGLELLVKKLSRNILRRTKQQAGIVLPEKTVIFHELDVDEETFKAQAKARKHMRDFATLVIDEKGTALEAFYMIALITRLRQIETWPAGIKVVDKLTKETKFELGPEFEESQKVDYIIRKEGDDYEGLIPDVIEDERVVVFSQFKAPLHELKRRIESMGRRAVILDGDTPDKLRDEIRHDFDRKITPDRADAKWDVLLANYKAAGVGLNLTNATQLITLDEEWNPGKREQAWDRIHRIGQTESVTINVIRTKGTIDTWLAQIIDAKTAVVDGFQEAVAEVTMKDLKDFLDNGGLA